MIEMVTSTSISGLIAGAAVFVILFVVLSVTLWVSIVAGAFAMLLPAAVGGAVVTRGRSTGRPVHH
jgi:hypothetical protein